ncbi:MAG: hypothetical protein WBD50_07675 [Candidatus Rhabdochlamydia sp.]
MGAKEEVDFEIFSYACPDIAISFEDVVNDHAKAWIILSDGSQWVIRNCRADEVVDHISTHWESGDEIRIVEREAIEYKGEYILKNVRNNEVYLVDLDVVSVDPAKSFYIEKIDKNGYAILTQNEIEWAIGWIGTFNTCKWRVGDRIIINKSGYSIGESYLIINADERSSVWASLISWR